MQRRRRAGSAVELGDVRMKRLLLFLVLLCPILLSGCVLDTILSDVVNKLPTAVISVDPGEGSAPLTVSFDAAYSHDDDGTIAEYRWDFGDPAVGGTGTAASCEHTYTIRARISPS